MAKVKGKHRHENLKCFAYGLKTSQWQRQGENRSHLTLTSYKVHCGLAQ